MMTVNPVGNQVTNYRGIASYHGLQRTMERLDCHEDQAMRVIKRAWEHGTVMEDLPLAKQRRYLEVRDGRFDDRKTQFRVYREHLFIFSPDGALVTMYPVPKDFSKRPHFIGKQHIRDFRQYERAKRMEYDLDYAM